MANYNLTQKAVADLADIWNYTYETWSENQADKYYQMLLDTCNLLANKPSKGKNYANIHPGLMGYKALRHIVFYIPSDGKIEIIRILHTSMDLKNKFVD